MKRRDLIVGGLAALVLGTCAYQLKTPQPSVPLEAPISLPAPTPKRQVPRFGTVQDTTPTLDTYWTFEKRPDAQYLIDVRFDFKQNRFGTQPPFEHQLSNPQTRLLELTATPSGEHYILPYSNGNAFTPINVKLEGTVILELREYAVPLPRLIRRFEFSPMQKPEEKRVY